MPESSTSQIEIRSEEVQEILTNPPSWIVRWGITLIFFFLLIIIGLSFLIKYPESISAKVLVTTKKPIEKVVARQSGQIEKLFVNNRDSIKNGEQLAIIKNTANPDDIFKLSEYIDTIKIDQIQNLTLPADKFSYLSLGEVSSSYIEFEESLMNYRLLENLGKYDNELLERKSSLMEMRRQLESQIEQKKLLDDEVELKERDFQRYKKLRNSGVISQQEFEQEKMEFIQMQKNISSMTINISQLRAAITSGKAELNSTNLNNTENNTIYLKNLLQSIIQLKEAIKNWKYKYLLVSNTNGSISFQEFWDENQYIQSGETVFSILPTNTNNLIGKLLIPASNAGKILKDQKVYIKLDNYPYQQYGMLVGKVRNLSVSPDENGSYTVYVDIPDSLMTTYKKEISFNQEMLGTADIVTEDLSLAERIFYKFKNIFNYS